MYDSSEEDISSNIFYDSLKNEGTYGLLTKLCEKAALTKSQCFLDNELVKSLRCRCYDMIIFKKNCVKGKIEELDPETDPMNHLLAWEYLLRTKYKNPELADKIDKICRKIKDRGLVDDLFKNVLIFLLSFRNLPQLKIHKDILAFDSQSYVHKSRVENEILQKSLLKYSESDFHLKENLPDQNIHDFLKGRHSVCHFIHNVKPKCDNELKNVFPDYEQVIGNLIWDLDKENSNVWEVAFGSFLSERRTWETVGVNEPNKEAPFITESGVESQKWIQHVRSVDFENVLFESQEIKIISYKQFVKDIKFLLVGIPSESFHYTENEFVFSSNALIEGLSQELVEAYCEDMLFCGNCFKELETFIASDNTTGNYQQEGYIFKEICESINQYINYYRITILSLSDFLGVLTIHNYVSNLHEHLDSLSSICQVGPYRKIERVLNGLELLNNFYKKILTTVKKDVMLILYSIFYPCIQKYFHKFLGRWILEGELNDPWAEFFISVNSQSPSSEERLYWTQSYFIKEDKIPEFLVDVKDDIRSCGKAMSLLKLCIPNSPLFYGVFERNINLFFCCVTTGQLIKLKQNCYKYYLDSLAKCGPQLTLDKYIGKTQMEKNILLGLIAEKRACTLKKIEMERKLKVELNLAEKRAEIDILKNDFQDAIKLKKSKEMKKIEREIQYKEALTKMEMLEMEVFHTETKNLINYYENLFKVADNYKEILMKETENVLNINLEDSYHLVPIESSESVFTTCSTNSKSDDVFNSAAESISNDENCIQIQTEESVECIDSTDELKIAELCKEQSAKSEFERNRQKSKSSQLGSIMSDVRMPNFNFYRSRYTYENNDVVELKKLHVQNSEEAKQNKLKFLKEELGNKSSLEDIINANMSTVVDIDNAMTTDTVNEDLNTSSTDNKESHDNLPEVFQDRNANLNKFKFQTTKGNNRNQLLGKKTTLVEDYLNENVINPLKITTNDTSLNLEQRKEKESLEQKLKVSQKSVDTPSGNEISGQKSSDSISDEKVFNDPVCDEECSWISKMNSLTVLMTSNSILDMTRNFENNAMLPSVIFPVNTEEVYTNSLKLFLQQSVKIPLKMQQKLVNNELLKFFIEELNYFKHLNNLRNYFFLLDGQFAKILTDNLFEKMYDLIYPSELVNKQTLNYLIQTALDNPFANPNSHKPLFRINIVPETLDLTNPNVLDCISLIYNVSWPLNILIPLDLVTKYEEVFKVFIKLKRAAWVLQKMIMEFKCLEKKTKYKKVSLLHISPQHQKIHQFRYIMTHFIQTLQNYINNEVLESSWKYFEDNLHQVKNLDNLYELHINYLKNVLFLCFLDKESLPLRKTIDKAIHIILRFYDFLRSGEWFCVDGIYKHQNFVKLTQLFKLFQEVVVYFFKIGMKVVNSGYQKNLLGLFDSLNINEYYTVETDQPKK